MPFPAYIGMIYDNAVKYCGLKTTNCGQNPQVKYNFKKNSKKRLENGYTFIVI